MRKLSRNLDKRKWNMIFRTGIWRSWLAVSKAYEVVWQSAVVLIGPQNWNLIPQMKTSFSFKFPVSMGRHPLTNRSNLLLGGAAQESCSLDVSPDLINRVEPTYDSWGEAHWKTTKAHLWKPRLGEGGVSRWQLSALAHWYTGTNSYMIFEPRIFLWFHQLRCCSWQCTRIDWIDQHYKFCCGSFYLFLQS